MLIPETELDIFKQSSPANYSVINENDVSGALNLTQIRDMLPNEFKFCAGWYLQQILKIAVANNLDDKNGYSLIWDADTVPLKHINFLSDENKLKFFMGMSFMSPNFPLSKKCLA